MILISEKQSVEIWRKRRSGGLNGYSVHENKSQNFSAKASRIPWGGPRSVIILI